MIPTTRSQSQDSMSSTNGPASHEEQAAKVTLPEFERALSQAASSLHLVADAHYNSQPKFTNDPVTRLVNARYYPVLLESFEKSVGRIISIYFNLHVRGVIANTDRGCCEIIADPDHIPSNIMALIDRLDDLCIRARELLHGRDLKVIMAQIYTSGTRLLGAADVLASKKKLRSESLEILNMMIVEVDERINSMAERYAKIQYSIGMLWSICTALIALSTTAMILILKDVVAPEIYVALGSAIAGGFGGIVSVMTRMTSGELKLDYNSGPRFLKLLGGFRPVVGAVFGLATMSLIMGGIIPLKSPSEFPAVFFFFCGIAFLAGFSERWAQDMLGMARGHVTQQTADLNDMRVSGRRVTVDDGSSPNALGREGKAPEDPPFPKHAGA